MDILSPLKVKIIVLCSLLFIFSKCYSQDTILIKQDSTWTLSDCIKYAQNNNLTVKQLQHNLDIALLDYKMVRYGRLPSLNLSSGYGANFGRSINPTTNQFENTNFSSIGLSMSSSVLLFGWFQKKYSIQNSDLSQKIFHEDLYQFRDNLILNVSTAYLRSLLAREQIENIKYQLEISLNNKLNIEKLLEAGKSNVMELSQSKLQLDNDNSAYIQAIISYEQAILDLKAILNLDFDKKLHPIIEESQLELLNEVNPDNLYNIAVKHVHSIKSSTYNIERSLQSIKFSQAIALPQLSLYYSTGTNYSSPFNQIFSTNEGKNMSFQTQFINNISYSFGLSLSIPVLNGLTSSTEIKKNKINYENAITVNEENLLKLKQDVFKACSDYKRKLQQYNLSLSAVSNADIAYNAANIRYENGFIPYFEYLAAKNNLLKAKNDSSAIKYDLQFKIMVLRYFMGSFELGT